LAPAEASSNLSRYDGVRFGYRAKDYKDLTQMYERTRSEGFGAEVKRRILIGTDVLSQGYYDAYYLQSQKIRRIIAQDFQTAFTTCDVLMGPVAPQVAWKVGEKSKDPVEMYLEDIYTLSPNLAGLPAMSIPCGMSTDNLPIGLQIIGNYFSEAQMIQIADHYQRVSTWHQLAPSSPVISSGGAL
jgi:aspartyl-tRNA(Asn)/glutamyl-tRNA(Gln) amidotransferase subunit A